MRCQSVLFSKLLLVQKFPVEWMLCWLRTMVTYSFADSALVRIRKSSRNVAHATFAPSITEQTAWSAAGLNALTIVQYDVKRQLDAGEVQVRYWCLLGFRVIGQIFEEIHPSICWSVTEKIHRWMDGGMDGCVLQQLLLKYTFDTTSKPMVHLQTWVGSSLVTIPVTLALLSKWWPFSFNNI